MNQKAWSLVCAVLIVIAGVSASFGADPAAAQAGPRRAYSSLSPADGSLINSSRPTISAEYVDEGIGVNAVGSRLFVDGVDVTAQSQSSANKIVYSPSAPLADGTHKVKLDIDDKAGNPSTVSWSFSVRTAAPKIKITSHTNGQYVNRTPVVITGSVDEARGRVVVNGIAAAVERGVFSAKVNIVEGANAVTAVATDAFGNTGSDSVTVVLDSKPPTIEITAPASNTLLNTKTVTVTGIAGKNASTVTVGGRAGAQAQPAEFANGTFTARDVKLDEGVNTITARAVSSAGNSGASTVKVIVDTVPPRITLQTPRNNSVTNKKMITVTGTVDDTAATVRVNNTPVQIAKGAFSLSGVTLSEGSNTITATAVDRAGNQAAAAAVTIVLDTTPPATPRLNDVPAVTRNSSLTVTGSAEPGAQVELFVNSGSKGAVKADDKGNFSFRISLVEGNNSLTAVASDSIGNAGAPSGVANVFLDTKPPKIL